MTGCKVGQMFIRRKRWTGGAVLWAVWGRGEEEGLKSCAVGQSVGGVGRVRLLQGAHVSQPIRSVLSRDRDLVLCGEAGLGGLLKVELLEAVE